MLLAATIVVLWAPSAATAAVPTDVRITAATKAWASTPLYVDPDYSADQEQMLQVIRSAAVPVYVAVVPTGTWFQEKGDTALLAGWLATANDKPGLYVVMDGDRTYGVTHRIHAYVGNWTYATRDQTMSSQLTDFLEGLRLNDRYDAEPARTAPLPPETPYRSEPDRFTVGDALRNGFGAGVLGLMGGAVLAGVVLGVAALAAPRRGGRS
jgi:hypothetical protein